MFPIGSYSKTEVSKHGKIDSEDLVIEEEPLEILIETGFPDNRKDHSVGITMRTPGNDSSLAIGLLFTSGILPGTAPVTKVEHCKKAFAETGQNNVIRVHTKEWFSYTPQFAQQFFRTGSCGVCGSDGIKHLKDACLINMHKVLFPIAKEDIFSLQEKLSSRQLYFNHTGGLHAAALFSRTFELESVFEDVGRHNALDKLIGSALLRESGRNQPYLLWLSCRAGFEMVQKAARFGIPVIACVGAPSGLAIRTANEMGITLIGFLREDRFNIYTFPQRLIH